MTRIAECGGHAHAHVGGAAFDRELGHTRSRRRCPPTARASALSGLETGRVDQTTIKQLIADVKSHTDLVAARGGISEPPPERAVSSPTTERCP